MKHFLRLNTSNSQTFIWTIFLLMMLPASSMLAGEDEKLKDWIMALRESARIGDTLSLTYVYTSTMHTGSKDQIVKRSQIAFCYDRPRFSFLEKILVKDRSLIADNQFFGYDGQQYELKYGNETVYISKDPLKLGDGAMTMDLQNPLLRQFLFLFSAGEKFAYSELDKPKVWAEFASRIVGVEHKVLGEKPTTIVHVRRDDVRSYTVYLDETLGMYPLKIESKGPMGSAISLVDDYKVITVGQQKMIIPLSIQVQSFSLDGKPKPIEEAFKVDGINTISPKEMVGRFTLSDSQSPEIFDLDLGTYIKRYQTPSSQAMSVNQQK